MRSCSGVRQLLAGRKSFPVRLGETVRQAVWLWPVVIVDAIMSKERQPFPFNLSLSPRAWLVLKKHNIIPSPSCFPASSLFPQNSLVQPSARPSVCRSSSPLFVSRSRTGQPRTCASTPTDRPAAAQAQTSPLTRPRAEPHEILRTVSERPFSRSLHQYLCRLAARSSTRCCVLPCHLSDSNSIPPSLHCSIRFFMYARPT